MKHPDSPPPREIELKLNFRPADRERLERQLSDASLESQRLVTIYFDTADHQLAEHGVTLRVRQIGQSRTQTIKARANGRNGPAAERGEWEWPIAGDHPDLTRLAETPFTGILASSSTLVPLFRTYVNRSIRLLQLDGGALIEAAIDDGKIIAGDQAEPILELELELKKGRRVALYRQALQLHDLVPLSIATESKFERGYGLSTGQPARPVKARAPSLTGKMRTDTAFRRIVDNDVGMMLANLALTLRGDVEGLHRMRVSLRQLRADFALFKPLLNERKTMVVSDRLRQLGRILGDARDWDVFSLETVPAVMDDTADRTGLGRLARVADTQRQASRKPVEEEIRAPEFTTLLLSLSAGLEDHHGAFLANHERLARPMDKVAPDLLDRALRKIRKRGKHIGRLKGPELHALRKSLKKLRYGVAALESLFGRKQVEVYLDECWALQKTLGNMNDANAAERLAQSLAENDQELRLPAGVIRKWAGRRRKKLQRKLDGAWSRLRGARPLWR